MLVERFREKEGGKKLPTCLYRIQRFMMLCRAQLKQIMHYKKRTIDLLSAPGILSKPASMICWSRKAANVTCHSLHAVQHTVVLFKW